MQAAGNNTKLTHGQLCRIVKGSPLEDTVKALAKVDGKVPICFMTSCHEDDLLHMEKEGEMEASGARWTRS